MKKRKKERNGRKSINKKEKEIWNWKENGKGRGRDTVRDKETRKED